MKTTKEYLISNQFLMKEWHWNKNVELGLNPSNLTFGSNRRAWWHCSKCSYTWESKISNRALLKRGCPCCARQIVVKGINDLASTHPHLAQEWHPTKNLLKPYEVVAGSKIKIWWQCPKGHEYQASLLHRKHGTRCPMCNFGRQTSFAEQCVFFYVKQLYPDAINRYKSEWLGNFELDIYIPSIHYAIEYDGMAWHKNETINREQRKYKLCSEKNIKLIRLREQFVELGSDIADYQYSCKNLYKPHNLEKILINLLTFLNFKGIGCPIHINIEKDKTLIQQYMQEIEKNSFADKFPDLAKEWHPTKNIGLSPNMFKPYSDKKVWWICKTCGYEYESTVGHRAYGSACKKCALRRFYTSNMRQVNMIDLSTNKIIKTFNSISEAANEMHINGSNITMVCKGLRKHAGGYIWQYLKK